MALSRSASASSRLSLEFSCSSSYSFGEALRLEAFGLRGFHAAVELLTTVVGGRGYLKGSADIGNGLSSVEQLLGAAQLADDLYSFGEAFGYGGVTLAFHGASPGQVWPVGKLS